MMLPTEENDNLGVFQPIIGPWYKSLENPQEAQNETLSKLLKEYQKTLYGRNHGASGIREIETYRKNFPAMGYQGLQPQLDEIKKGNYDAILPEPLTCWVMTRGSTGPAKVLPTTKTHLEQIFTCGARGLINHVLRTKDFELLAGKILNLNFPSNVHTVVVDGSTMSYGYSSGTYARLNPALDSVSLLPLQEDIDALGPGITKQDWEKRFELAYQQALNVNVTAAMGVTPVILSFARYVNQKHRKKPKELWNMHALFCTSVRKIQFKYAPVLKKYFGQVPVVEIYSATEGVFAQQLNTLPYVTPNYDTYLFEVETSKGIKMLYELNRGEWGRLVVSSCIFPRYRIGDLVESAGKNYFRIFGRDKASTLLEHRLFRLFFGWFT
jgi:hypothetical protein